MTFDQWWARNVLYSHRPAPDTAASHRAAFEAGLAEGRKEQRERDAALLDDLARNDSFNSVERMSYANGAHHVRNATD